MPQANIRDQYFAGKIKTPVFTGEGENRTRALKDMNIVFSCPIHVAEWLEIDAKYKIGSNNTQTIPSHSRNNALVGGGSGTSTVAQHERAIGARGRVGSKVVTINTGKQRASKKGKYQISFRFPQKTTAIEIADLLGSVIPANKISSTPGAAQVQNKFRLVGGKTYGIMSPAQATASTEAQPKEQAASPTP